jgi:3-deoxy-D-manno-octulosonic-acid transferase
MNPLYNIGILAYRSLVRLVSVRNQKARLMIKGQSRTYDKLRNRLDKDGGYIWIHASSLGEFEQGRPLIEMIKSHDANAKILLTFFSPSGYEVRKNYDKVDLVCYLPFDLPHNVKKFLDLVKPSMAIFVKYEFWGNYLGELHRRDVPTYIISSIFRPGQIFFRPWGGIFRGILKDFTTIFVQNEESKRLLGEIGVNNVVIGGDTRFDRVADVRDSAKEFPVIAKFVENHPFTLIMGSSWQPDEDIVIPYFNTHPQMKLIIAPHEFDMQRLRVIMSKITRNAAFYSATSEEGAGKLDCIIIDCFGILSSLYRYGQMAYIGGGFGAGIHNINEAAVYNIPVVFGPNNGKFREAKDLIDCGGGFEITTAEQFSEVADSLLNDRDNMRHCGAVAGNYIKSHLGSTQLIYKAIFCDDAPAGDK